MEVVETDALKKKKTVLVSVFKEGTHVTWQE